MHSITTQARTWLGTRFHHQGRIKKTTTHKGGVDCLGLLMGVAKDLSLTSRDGITPLHTLDSLNYGNFPDGKLLRHMLQTHLYEISTPQAGDIVLMTFDHNPQHLGILSNHPHGGFGLIHAYAPARCVVEHRLDAQWHTRIDRLFRVFPKK